MDGAKLMGKPLLAEKVQKKGLRVRGETFWLRHFLKES